MISLLGRSTPDTTLQRAIPDANQEDCANSHSSNRRRNDLRACESGRGCTYKRHGKHGFLVQRHKAALSRICQRPMRLFSVR